MSLINIFSGKGILIQNKLCESTDSAKDVADYCMRYKKFSHLVVLTVSEDKASLQALRLSFEGMLQENVSKERALEYLRLFSEANVLIMKVRFTNPNELCTQALYKELCNLVDSYDIALAKLPEDKNPITTASYFNGKFHDSFVKEEPINGDDTLSILSNGYDVPKHAVMRDLEDSEPYIFKTKYNQRIGFYQGMVEAQRRYHGKNNLVKSYDNRWFDHLKLGDFSFSGPTDTIEGANMICTLE